MKKIGIIAEYNPFHNGHIYHLKEIRKQFPNSVIVLVLSSHFTQRGIPSILNKWDKTYLALQYGVDLVLELPFAFTVQSADFFAQGAIEILSAVGVDTLVFGSESNNVQQLINLADLQLTHPDFSKIVKQELKKGKNYPTALNDTLTRIGGEKIIFPNDLLGLSYIKQIKKQHSSIVPITIKRTNSYHDETLNESISSATSVRKALFESRDISSSVPDEVVELLKCQPVIFLEDFFPFLQYKIYSSSDLKKYLDVDEGIENRILEKIDSCDSFEDLIQKIKSKRYTYNKINRMLLHILCEFTKEEKKAFEHISYLRILGFSKVGQELLHEIKKTCKIPIYTTFQKKILGFQLEKRVTSIYAIPLKREERKKLIEMEYKMRPIQRKDESITKEDY